MHGSTSLSEVGGHSIGVSMKTGHTLGAIGLALEPLAWQISQPSPEKVSLQGGSVLDGGRSVLSPLLLVDRCDCCCWVLEEPGAEC